MHYVLLCFCVQVSVCAKGVVVHSLLSEDRDFDAESIDKQSFSIK